MALKAANFATATDAEINSMFLGLLALNGGLNGVILNPPVDLTPFQLDVLRPLLLAEVYRRALIPILRINALP